MELFQSSMDLLRIVFLAGAVLALIYKKKMGVVPGGVVVPGTLAAVLSTSFTAFLIAIATAIVVIVIYKFTFAHYPLGKRWRAIAHMSISVVIGLALTAITTYYQVLSQEALLLTLIAPGMIANATRNYGIVKVFTGTFAVTALACLVGIVVSWIVPIESLTYMSVQLATYVPLTLVNPYITLTVSMVVAILIYWNFGIRGGGYLMAPFFAATAFSAPLQALLLAIGIALGVLAIHLIQKYTLIVGLERFVVSLFIGYFIVSALDILAITVGIENYRPAPLITIIVAAVFINDIALQGTKKTVSKGYIPSLVTSYLTRLAV